MQERAHRRTQQARDSALVDALAALQKAATELSQPVPDPALLDSATDALRSVTELCGLPNALRLAELIALVQKALALVRESQGRVLLAPYVQAIALDLQSSVAAYTAGVALDSFLEHARGLLHLLEEWQPDRLVPLHQFESQVRSDDGTRESPVLKATSQLTSKETLPPSKTAALSFNGSTHSTARRRSAEAPSPNPPATISEILSTSDMLLTALRTMPSRLELLDSLNVCASTVLDMVAGYPEPLPRLAAAAADLLAAYRAKLVVPGEEVCEYLRTVWLMSTLLLTTPDPPRALLNAVEALLAECPSLPRAPVVSSVSPRDTDTR
jgi:hypothetical protein